MRRYKVLLPLEVHLTEAEGGGSYKQGEEFSKEFASPEDEQANLDSGLLEIVPCEYKVIGGSTVNDAAPGETFEAALGMGQEALLIEGGHIERVESKPAKAKAKTKQKEE